MFPYNKNKLNITLCGMMGSGKSSLGKKIAKKINYSFIDIDKLIEDKMNKSISDIFEQNGEQFFRKLEEDITIKNLNTKKAVISLGGGSILNKSIRSSIKKNSINIYLEVKNDILINRLKNSKNRPLIKNKNLEVILNDLKLSREKYYKEADMIIQNEGNVEDASKKIIEILSNEKNN